MNYSGNRTYPIIVFLLVLILGKFAGAETEAPKAEPDLEISTVSEPVISETSSETSTAADTSIKAESSLSTSAEDLLLEDQGVHKIVPMVGLSQTSFQARDRSQISSRGDFSMVAGAMYEIPMEGIKLRTGLVYLPIKGKLIDVDQQETVVNLSQIAIPLEAQYQIARENVDGLFLKGTAIAALKVGKSEGFSSDPSAKTINGAGDLILGLGVVKVTPLNSAMDIGVEANVLKGQLGYRLEDQTLDQSAIQALVTLNIKQ